MPDPQGGVRLDVKGFVIWKGHLSPAAQALCVDQIRAVAAVAPFTQYQTPGGRRMSVKMTSAGRYGWLSDRRGYRYAPEHPSGVPWPPIPEALLGVWRDLAGSARDPDSLLINYYGEGAKMGLHVDDTEQALDQPVVSISLGDPGLFRMGGVETPTPTSSLWLESGDVVVMGGAARLAHHGVDRIRFGASSLLPKGGRINLTLRVVSPDPAPA